MQVRSFSGVLRGSPAHIADQTHFMHCHGWVCVQLCHSWVPQHVAVLILGAVCESEGGEQCWCRECGCLAALPDARGLHRLHDRCWHVRELAVVPELVPLLGVRDVDLHVAGAEVPLVAELEQARSPTTTACAVAAAPAHLNGRLGSYGHVMQHRVGNM